MIMQDCREVFDICSRKSLFYLKIGFATQKGAGLPALSYICQLWVDVFGT